MVSFPICFDHFNVVRRLSSSSTSSTVFLAAVKWSSAETDPHNAFQKMASEEPPRMLNLQGAQSQGTLIPIDQLESIC